MSYGRIHETFWHDDKVRALPEDARNLMLYLLSCPHRNRIGCFVLDPYYAGGDLQWERVRVEEALRELADAGRIGFDPHTRVVLITNYLKHNPMANENVVKGAVKELARVPDTPLLGPLRERLHEHWKDRYELLDDALADRIDGLGDTDPPDILAEVENGSTEPRSNRSETVTQTVPKPSRNGIGTGTGTGEGGSTGEDSPTPSVVSPSPEETEPDPHKWMHEIWHEVLGIDGHPINLTDKRKSKYRAMYDEQLKGTPDPEAAWRAVLFAVTQSEHHMSQRSYQMPESILRNEERRSTWVQNTISVLRDGGRDVDRRAKRRQEEIRRGLEASMEADDAA